MEPSDRPVKICPAVSLQARRPSMALIAVWAA
jgi:hypothetical protein